MPNPPLQPDNYHQILHSGFESGAFLLSLDYEPVMGFYRNIQNLLLAGFV